MIQNTDVERTWYPPQLCSHTVLQGPCLYIRLSSIIEINITFKKYMQVKHGEEITNRHRLKSWSRICIALSVEDRKYWPWFVMTPISITQLKLTWCTILKFYFFKKKYIMRFHLIFNILYHFLKISRRISVSCRSLVAVLRIPLLLWF